MKRIVIIGGGISGLTTAWYLKKLISPLTQLIIIEKNSRLGGWIDTVEKEGFLFEKGPRTLRVSDEQDEVIKLIDELGLNKVYTSPSAKKKYLWTEGALQPLPTHPLSLLLSPLTKGCLATLLRERKIPPSPIEDETIENFFQRRFNQKIAETFVDPLVSGIFAGDPKQLSMRSCFPSLLEKEQKYGSIVKSFLSNRKKTQIFSFKNGMKELTTTLAQKLKEKNVHFLMGNEITHIEQKNQKVRITLKNDKLEADFAISTLSTNAMSSFIKDIAPIPFASVAVVNLGFTSAPSKPSGFGLLIPSKEKEIILGITFDSDIFPHMAPAGGATLTVMMGGFRYPHITKLSENELLHIALDGLKRICGIDKKPTATSLFIAQDAIPQFPLFYHRQKTEVERALKEKFPSLLCTNLSNIGVNECISSSYHLAKEISVSL